MFSMPYVSVTSPGIKNKRGYAIRGKVDFLSLFIREPVLGSKQHYCKSDFHCEFKGFGFLTTSDMALNCTKEVIL